MEQGQEKAPFRPARILVVDDERHIARFLVYVLTREGYEAQAVYDGEEALAVAETYAPDAVLLDLLLPKLSGQEVLVQLRANPRFGGLKILMLTGCPVQDETAANLISSKPDAYCLKPIGPSVLVDLLRQHGLYSRPGQKAAS
jgi:DNA-binding response OmpR family regulator